MSFREFLQESKYKTKLFDYNGAKDYFENMHGEIDGPYWYVGTDGVKMWFDNRSGELVDAKEKTKPKDIKEWKK